MEKGYKAFEPGLVCRGKQYAENTTFEEAGGGLCSAGMMHYCANPLDCLDYYPLLNDDCELNDFAEVVAEEPPVGDGKKFATKKLHIGAKLDLKGFIKAAFSFIWESSERDGMTASADEATKLAASGDNSKLAASGDNSKLAASGYYSKLAASGDYSQLAASGYNSVVSGIGIGNVAKAALGCWICLAEWEYNSEKERGIPVCVKAAKIDGETLKPDTWYKLENGEFAEVKNG